MNLEAMGLTKNLKNDFDRLKHNEEMIIGRVALEHKRMYRVWTEQGELLCEVTGNLALMQSIGKITLLLATG